MGFFSRIAGQAGAQFLDVIQFLDDSDDTIVWRFPIHDQAITDESKVIVREGQAAVFVSEGTLSDVFAPGTYTLDTPNAPIRSFFQTIGYGMRNPYKGDVLFVSTRQLTDNPWGTQNPFMMRDAEFGPVRVRAFGSYSFRVTDPATFVRQIVGTYGHFTTDEIANQLKKRVVAAFVSALGKAGIPVLDLAAQYMDIGDRIRDAMNGEFQDNYGITLTDFTVGNISLPDEVEKALDTRSKMGILGNLDAYTKLAAADAMTAAAENPGSGGAGIGLGMGMGVGHAMAGQMANAAATPGTFDPQTGLQPPPPPVAEATLHYHGADGQQHLTAEQIAQRVAADPDAKHHVWKPGWPEWKPATDVDEVAALLHATPPPPPGDEPPPLPE